MDLPPDQTVPSQQAGDFPEFKVATLVASALDAFISAAALHLGDPTPDGRKLASRDPMEAWAALLSASALMDQLAPVMNREFRLPFETALKRLLAMYAEQYPDVGVPAPGLPVASLKGMVESAFNEPQPPAPAPAAPARPSRGTKPLNLPGTGLPARGSGPLFPR